MEYKSGRPGKRESAQTRKDMERKVGETREKEKERKK
jgi:hypothetical protein